MMKTREEVFEMISKADTVNVPTMIFGSKFHVRVEVTADKFSEALQDWGSEKIPMNWFQNDPSTRICVVHPTEGFTKMIHGELLK